MVFLDVRGGAPALGEVRADDAVEEVGGEDGGEGVAVVEDDEAEEDDSAEELGDGAPGAPVEGLEAWVGEAAEHHEAEEEHEEGEDVFPRADFTVVFVNLEEEEGNGGDEAGGGGDGEAAEFLEGFGFGVGGEDVEAGEAEGTAGEVNEGDEPADAVGEFSEDDFEDEEGGGDAEGDDVGEGIELAAEGAFLAAEPGEAAIEHIAEEGTDDEEEAAFVVEPPALGGGLALDGALEDAEDGHETAEEVACGHEVRQEEDGDAAVAGVVHAGSALGPAGND